jgi:hypothetical protein
MVRLNFQINLHIRDKFLLEQIKSSLGGGVYTKRASNSVLL